MLQRVLRLLLSVIALFHLGTVAAATSLETETPFVFSVDRESYYGGERIESVSYTHLDVYKRQGIAKPAHGFLAL